MDGNLHQPSAGSFDRWTAAYRFRICAVLAGLLLAAFAVKAAGAVEQQPTAAPPQPAQAAAVSEALPPPGPTKANDAAKPPDGTRASFRAIVRGMVEQEVRKTGLPADVADAVVHIESNYDPSVIGRVGEIGLMQIRPGTAAMLGFKGNVEELARPETNIHYGVTYLSQAWRLANGDLCRTLMKYRAGHGEEVMTPRSQNYCNRARLHLAGLGSPLAAGAAPPAILPASVVANPSPKLSLTSPRDVYAFYKQGTPAASRAFWAAHDARVRAISARIEARWRRVSSR